MSFRWAAAAFAVLSAGSPFPAVAGDSWTAFRGSDGSGVVAGADLPVEFGDGQNVAWKTPIHGKGWSSPVVLGGQIWLTTATEDGKKMSVVCVDAATGEIVHDRLLFENEAPTFAHAANSYASCTPTIEPGRVYVHFGHYGTACLDTKTCRTIWERRDIDCDEFRGPASSPILYKNLLVFSCDGADFQFVIALDKATGKTVWRTPRDIDYGTDDGDFKKAYSTPGVFEIDGRTTLVSSAAVETVAYDPDDGAELWRVRHGWMNAGTRPLMIDGTVLIAAGKDDTSLVAVRPQGSGEQTANVVWKSNKGVSQKPSPILVDGLLFMMADDGVASCRDPQTGEILWMKRVGGEYWSSPVSDGKNIYCFGKEGRAPVFAASADFQLVAENRFAEGFHATPAIVEDTLFVRGREFLYRIEKTK